MPGDPRLGAAWALAVSETTADDAAFLQLEADTSRLGPDQLYVIGRKLEELQAQPAAVKIYNAILNSTPLYFPAHERLALLYSQAEGIKDPVKALGHFRHALELRPDYQSRPEFAAIVNSLEKEYMMAGDTVKSRQLREEFTGTSPDEQGADEPRP
jgi:tetratricopeptide (TPR) repeat protein